MDHIEKARRTIAEYKTKVIKPLFPNAQFAESRLFCNPDRPVSGFNGFLSTSDLFKNSIYECPGDGLFLHFTSFPVLSTILKTGFIRMSDFNCLSDKLEINFASKNINLSSKQEDNKFGKHKMFCLSACDSKHEVITDPYMWEKYADNGAGCSIEYKFTSPEIYKMSFGRILYGKRDLKPLKDIKRLMENFSLENNGFKVNSFESFLTRIFAFHKDIKYKKENEVRLFHFQDGGMSSNARHINQYPDFYKNNEVREFIRIYLSGKNKHVPCKGLDDETALGISPQIEITRVIIGPNVKNILDVRELIIKLRDQEKQNFEIWSINDKLVCSKLNV